MQSLFLALERAGETRVLSMSKISPPQDVKDLFENLASAREKEEGRKTIFEALVSEKNLRKRRERSGRIRKVPAKI